MTRRRCGWSCWIPSGASCGRLRTCPICYTLSQAGPLEMTRLLTWATDELDRRLDSGKRGPRVVVVVEEIADLLRVNPDAAGGAGQAGASGAGAGRAFDRRDPATRGAEPG